MKAVWFNQLDFASLCRTSRLELARAFARLGHTLRLIGRYRHQQPRFPSLRPRPLLLRQYLPDPAGGLFFQLQVLMIAASEVLRNVDLIMVDHFCVPTMLPLNLLSRLRLIRTKFVLDIRSSPVDMVGTRYAISRWRYSISIRWARLFYDGITVITDLYRKDISSHFGINPTTIGVWSSGVLTDIFAPRAVDRTWVDSIKSTLGLKDKLVVMYHGVLSAYRGLEEAVRALALLNREGFQEAALVFLGDGPAARDIRSLAEAEGVAHAVKLVDPVPYEDVPNYLSICHAGILPFPNCAWWKMSSPLKLMEYLAMEKPVILTDIPAHRAVMADAPCAFYVDDASPASIARALRRLSEQKAALSQIGKKGSDIVLRKFTWEKQADNLLNYVSRLRRAKD